MNSMIVIGDVHGCYETLKALIAQLPLDIPICMTGDLVDRGPKNRKVVNFVRRWGIPCVVGNHELLMYADSPELRQCWMMNGGRETYKEYDGDIEAFQDDCKWMSELPLYLEFPDIKNADGRHLVVSHTTLARHWDDRDHPTTKHEAAWERKHIPASIPEVFNVYGHTPVRTPVIREYFANIDTGCVYAGSCNMGKLTALQFPEMKVYQQENIDMLDGYEATV